MSLAGATVLTKASTFGGRDDQEDNGQFAFGGGSIDNPELYAAFPEELYNDGTVEAGGIYPVTNPKTGKTVHVVARDKGPSERTGRGLDLAPAAMKELGADTDEDLQVSFTPVGKAPQIGSGPQSVTKGSDLGMASLSPIGNAPYGTEIDPDTGETINDTEPDTDTDDYSHELGADPKPVKNNPDGTILFDDGGVYNPKDGSLTKGGFVFTDTPDGKVAKRVIPRAAADKPEIHDSLIKQMLDRRLSPYDESGKMISAADAVKQINQYDTDNGILSPAQEKVAQQVSQQLNSSRNPSVAGFYKVKPKYDSIVENISSKPLGERNGVDDAFLLNAAAGIENVDRAPTINDYKEMLRSAGIKGNIEVMSERLWGLFNNDPKYYENRGTRILSDAQIKQLQSNAERILKPRKDLFLKAITPQRNRLKAKGIPEDQVIPLGIIDDEDTASAQPAPASSSTPPPAQEKLTPAVQQAQQILAKPSAYPPDVVEKAKQVIEAAKHY